MNITRNTNEKIWVTVFAELEPVHMYKDVGMIPYIMAKYHGYKSYLLTAAQSGDISNNYVSVVETSHGFIGKRLSIFIFLLFNAKRIDVLNTFHMSLIEMILWFLPYKILNRKGKIYLKMDLSMKYVDDYIKNPFLHYARKKLLNLADLATAESNKVCSVMNKYYDNRIKHLPNGFYWELEGEAVAKQDIVLCVARLGSPPKNTEGLLQGFLRTSDSHTWKLHLAGTMERGFKAYYDNFLEEHPEIKDRIVYEGEITDRKKLMEIYQRAKIFVLSSLWEGFPLVMCEALSQGCYLIGTDAIPPVEDIIIDDRIGRVCKAGDVTSLANAINDSIAEGDYGEMAISDRIKYAVDSFSWIKIGDSLIELLSV